MLPAGHVHIAAHGSTRHTMYPDAMRIACRASTLLARSSC